MADGNEVLVASYTGFAVYVHSRNLSKVYAVFSEKELRDALKQMKANQQTYKANKRGR